MAQNTTLVALSQMVDLSLNCHEGVVNFQVLHTLLHVMIQQLQLHEVGVEFRGEDSDKIQTIISTMKPMSTVLLPEYSITGRKNSGPKKKASTPKKKISLHDVVKDRSVIEEKKEKEIRVIERRKDSKEDPEINPLPLKSPPGSLLGLTPGDLQTIVVVESQAQLPQFSVAVSKAAFDDLQNDVDKLKVNIKELIELPGNMGLIEASRSQSGPIVDMFQILNITKRMEATETAMEKMGSLIEDLARHTDISEDLMEKVTEVRESIDVQNGSIKKSSITKIETRIVNLEDTVRKIVEGGITVTHTTSEPSTQETIVEESIKDETDIIVETEVSSVSTSKKSTTKDQEKDDIKLWSPQGPYTSAIQNLDLLEMSHGDAIAAIQGEFANLKKWVSESIQEVDKVKVFASLQGGEVNTQAIDTKFSECTKKMEELNDLYNHQIGMLNEQMISVQHEITEVAEKIDLVLPGGDSTGITAETTMDLANKLVLLENEMLLISERAAKLQEEKEERDKQTEEILEQIDVLKIVKANREDLEDALGDKADACMINRKVSHDQFDAACDDLSRGIEEALAKLEEQQEMWRQALETIQKEVGNKLDKMEVDPLRDFVNSKLKALQDKFKALTALKKEQEAAGTKSKILRNVHCISCDKDVVMRREMDVSLKPKAYAMPPSRNIAPYLAYELDQLRKQQTCVPGSKNLNFIESALKTRGARDKDHVCNRYCGGSHTVTTPQQRVARLGHFLEQWGPEISPINEEYIRGNDNHMYKARDETMYSKGGKESRTKPTVRQSEDLPAALQEAPQQDRNTFVNADAHEAISKDGEEARINKENRKSHNIGSTGIAPDEAQAMAGGSQDQSQIQEPRGSQARESQVRPSQSGEPRPSQAGEARPSQAGQPRPSQAGEPRPSQAGEPRPSQAGQPRQSQAAEPRPSQAGQPRTSQAGQPRQSQAGETRPSQAGEPKMSQSGEPRPSQGGAPRQSQTGERRASQTSEKRQSQAQGEPRPSQASTKRVSQTQNAGRKSSQTQNVEAKVSPTQQG